MCILKTGEVTTFRMCPKMWRNVFWEFAEPCKDNCNFYEVGEYVVEWTGVLHVFASGNSRVLKVHRTLKFHILRCITNFNCLLEQNRICLWWRYRSIFLTFVWRLSLIPFLLKLLFGFGLYVILRDFSFFRFSRILRNKSRKCRSLRDSNSYRSLFLCFFFSI